MTPEEKRAYQNGLICGLSVRSVMDTADGQRKAILADMTEINQTMPANSTWEAIHKAIRSWNISGPRIKVADTIGLTIVPIIDMVGTVFNIKTDSSIIEVLSLNTITLSDAVSVTLT